METSASSALVIWGSTGKRLQFTRQDLQMPESVKERPNYHFFEKQWDSVAGFWMNRVLKEVALQHLTVENIVKFIVSDIERRWEQRKKEKALYKKIKRLLEYGNMNAAGAPSPHVLITNVVSLDSYRRLLAEGTLQELVAAVLEKVEEVAKEKVAHHTILVDDEGDTNTNGNDDISGTDAEKVREKKKEPRGDADVEDGGKNQAKARKRPRPEQCTDVSFDDHVAFVCTLSSEAKAARVVSELHGSMFDSRAVLCRFYAL
ncbi:hypothetical protein TraAM80_05308 [Trypanosoma rangeli]|uniref:Uncharacterized protein n=1 Tax=Trypanosoma rangeli TaxID=5698 RepID=A0A3R7KLV2_TRYRA|nr:uncharacterized protein TraAM80_05308 [Trypanosoma rangeli]RNF04156.1 hypothetical protein TraAM80_05308 [Trypanosoma rangeli]|eukprot:RNF04156.1 hypothetical protein TraAM80_05308 [Trypanosoma rangeli]